MAHDKLILGRYRVMSDAGSGGFATVKVAWDTTMQRKVAIKIIELDEAYADYFAEYATYQGGHSEFNGVEVGESANEGLVWYRENAEDDVEVAGFEMEHSLANIPGLDEARAVSMLNDGNIVTVHDFQMRGTTAYLIMEYVDGITLSQFLKRQGDDLSLDVVTAVFSSVAHALEVAHRNQVLHLDIKPDNVLINRQGQVKVTDFGLATLMDASGYGMTGGGTIGYMPPEQMRQEGLDARCDQWALASLTYEMLSGRNPFLARDLESAEAAIEDAELVLPSLCWQDVDPALDEVMFMALDPDPDERFASIVDFAEELEPLLGDAKVGHRELAQLVSAALGEGVLPSAGETTPKALPRKKIPFAQRITDRVALAVSRAVAVLASALMSAVALANMPMITAVNGGAPLGVTSLEEMLTGAWGNPILWGLVLLVILAAAIRPHAGALTAGVLLAVSLFMNKAYIVAIILLAATAAWWHFFAKRSAAQTDVALASPLFGAFGCTPFAPVLAGCFLPLMQAIAAVGYAALLAVVMAGFGSESLMGWYVWENWDYSQVNIQGNVVRILAQPATWVVIVSWLAAAVAFSAFCYRGSHAFDIAGSVVAALLLVAGACIAGGLSAHLAEGGPAWMQAIGLLAPTLVAAVVGVAAAVLDIPDRARWE